ncbi:type VII secretion-associated serine protease mycosin [Saccharopolyspora rectivirgula]|nr:type VII secretion-associated serine protease mycosin [Saccharopolyspora rectivirgula]
MRRALALSAAVGTLALSGPALPAAAEEVGPPALDPSKQAAHELTPFNYPQKQGCMAGNPNPTVIEEKPWSQLVLGFEQAHEQGLTGQGMKVAVIDTGVNAAHPRLRNVTDGGSSVPGGALRDCDGHGTIVAGIIAASPDPETGFVGVAPDAEILSIRQSSSLFRDDETNRTIGNTETMAQAINIAVDRQVDVINISQSSCQDIARASNYNEAGNQMLHNAVKRAYDAGIVVVAAAGNAGNTCQQNAPGSPSTAVLPAWFDDYVLTVASVNEQGAPSEFTVAGPWVDVAAPGENLIALDPGINGRGLVNQISTGDSGQMGPIQGTSFAAPYVSGLAVLIKQKFQNSGQPLDAGEIMERIKKTALHPGGPNGRNDIVGYGMIDPMAALGDVIPAEWGKEPAPSGPTKLSADVLGMKDYPALIVSLGVAGAGIAAVVFTAFLVNAVKNVRARTTGKREE